MSDPSIFTVGGTVQAGGGIYLLRPADEELLQHCKAGNFSYVLTARQMGKSSLMVRTAAQLNTAGTRTVIIDLTRLGTNLEAEQWYLGLIDELVEQLNLNVDYKSWWELHTHLGTTQRLSRFLREIILEVTDTPIVIFIDEIDTTLSVPFSDDIFAAIRACYNARGTDSVYRRLSFVLLGVATPSDLIRDPQRTPFNIGQRIDLTDFTLTQALPLVKGLGLSPELGYQVLEWVIDWTGGHPYLMQRLCRELVERARTDWDKEAVAKVVEETFFGQRSKQDGNLQFVHEMLTRRAPDVRKVLQTYRQILQGKKSIKSDEQSLIISHLKLSGMVGLQEGTLTVRNKIYRTVFSDAWIHENIPRNGAKIAAVSSAIVSAILLFILIFDFVVNNLSTKYSTDFITTGSPTQRIEDLAKIFRLRGILQNSNYAYLARQTFYSLPGDEQVALFKNSKTKDPDFGNDVVTSITGLYVTLANVESEQDSSPLLQAMYDSLGSITTNDAKNLRNEIGLWLEARQVQQTSPQNAYEKYSQVIEQVNNNNPATHYERARIAISLGLYETALLDLDTTLSLAQNISSEASEGEISTPTSLPTSTPESATNTPIAPVAITPLQTSSVSPSFIAIVIGGKSGITSPTIPIVIPTSIPPLLSTPIPNGPNTSSGKSFKSSFYSIAYIRGAVNVLLEYGRQKPGFDNTAITLANRIPHLINTGLLPKNISTEIAFMQTPQGGLFSGIATSIFPQSPTMTGGFRIAVASFIDNTNSGDNSLGFDIANSIYNGMAQENDALPPPLAITIWGPDKISAITGNTSLERAITAQSIAKKIKADFLVYGVVNANGAELVVYPEFYVSNQNFYEASELVGQQGLGAPISLSSLENAARRFELTQRMVSRADILQRTSIGLNYFALRDYDNALAFFQSALNTPGWADNQGKEVLYYLAGKAANGVAKTDLAQAMFFQSLQLNPGYAKSYIGLAELNYFLALQPFDVSKNPKDIDQTSLEKCFDYLNRAAEAPDQPPLADVQTKIHFARGQCLLLMTYSGHLPDFTSAIPEFQQVIDAYQRDTNPRIREIAAESYARLGLIYQITNQRSEAAKYYQKAANLLFDNPERQALYQASSDKMNQALHQPTP